MERSDCMSQRTASSLFAFIENRLIDFGLSPQYAGYHYLAHAIHWSILDRQTTMHLNTNLYPRIAKSFNVTSSAVEHGIRNLLCTAWKHRESPALSNLFAIISGPPTNARSIAFLSRAIRSQYFLARQQAEHLSMNSHTVS